MADAKSLLIEINDLKIKLEKHNSFVTAIEARIYKEFGNKGLRIVKVSKDGVYYTFYEIINQIIWDFLFSRNNSMNKIFCASISERHDEHDRLILGAFIVGKGSQRERDNMLKMMRNILTRKTVVKSLIRLKLSKHYLLAEIEEVRRKSAEISERINTDRYSTICECCPRPEGLAAMYQLNS